MKKSPTQEITALHLDFSEHSTRISCNKKSPKHTGKYPLERVRISLCPSLIFLHSPGTSPSRLQVSLETHSIPGMEAWHIRVHNMLLPGTTQDLPRNMSGITTTGALLSPGHSDNSRHWLSWQQSPSGNASESQQHLHLMSPLHQHRFKCLAHKQKMGTTKRWLCFMEGFSKPPNLLGKTRIPDHTKLNS